MEQIEQRFIAVANSKTFGRITRKYKLDQKKVLDIGCSYGEFLTRFGPGSMGVTTVAEEVEYAKRQGLRTFLANAESEDFILPEKFEVIWANNLFEHLLSPHRFLVRLKSFLADEGLLILGVPMVPQIISLMKWKKFRGALASNHINFFNHRTLRLTVERAGWEVVEMRPFVFGPLGDYLFRSLAPHLYLVARPIKGFVYPEKKLAEWRGQRMYEDLIKQSEKQ